MNRSSFGSVFPLLAFSVVVFYWTPLTSTRATPQWDAVDVHYTAQKYFADELHQGRVPYWTPYVFSGFPFLADPQVGAWYPLNWPFFLIGIGPKSIEAELALHCLLALFGAYLLAWRWFRAEGPATLAALCYAYGGFFAGHSSHVGMFQTAAWLPWLLLAAQRSVETGRLAWMAAAGLITGVLALAGHFQTAVYSGFAVVCLLAWITARDRSRVKPAALTLAACTVLGFLVAAIEVIPGVELVRNSVRASMDFGGATNSPLVPSALLTVLFPNALGAIEGGYTGPQDITQYYFYAGFLLLPLAVWGAWKSPLRGLALALILPALWFSLGPAGGFYSVLAKLPGLGSVRAPVHIWFVCALGLALLAGAGLAALATSRGMSVLVWIVPLVFSRICSIGTAPATTWPTRAPPSMSCMATGWRSSSFAWPASCLR